MLARVNTPQEVKDFFEELIDDTIGDTFFYQLLNKANDELIGERDWELFKATDETNTANTSDTYLTMKDLPTDFLTPRRFILVGTQEYRPIPFEKRIVYKDGSRLYYIDYANAKFALCGSINTAQTIVFIYNKIPTEILSSDSTSEIIIKWPSVYRTILAFKMADIIEAGVDADTLAFRMSAKQREEYNRIRKQLESWDARLKLHAMDFSSAPINDGRNDDYNTPDKNLGNY